MKKIKIGVVFGGVSSEHDVSKVSGTSVIHHLDKHKYDILPIYIGRDGKWYLYQKPVEQIQVVQIQEDLSKDLKLVSNIEEILQSLDVVFPVLHGIGGEDGSIQGLFELFHVPYVGCGILASSLGMDKAYAKVIFEKAGIQQAKYQYLRKCNHQYLLIDSQFNETLLDLDAVSIQISKHLPYPMFVKPSNSGSSIGIRKVNNVQELKDAIEYASQFDQKILVEEGIKGREVECAVLGNEQVIASCVGEIKPAEEFYTYDAKYQNKESKVCIPADFPKAISDEIKRLAIKAFKAINGSGLARVDFFVKEDNDQIYINEINTLPGFTTISMYPQLFMQEDISYAELLDRLILLALKRNQNDQQ